MLCDECGPGVQLGRMKGMVMRKTLVVALIGAMAGGAIVGGATYALAQRDPIAARKDNCEQASAVMKAIKGIIDAKAPTASAVQLAAKLKGLQLAFVKYFPRGSDKGDTRALPAVWSDMAGFAARNKAAEVAYEKLAVAAGSGDLGALAAAFGAAGKACGACHDTYRAK